MVTNTNLIPLYVQIKEQIISDINNNKLKFGDKIESELEIIEKYNVSRITVRKAISELVSEGYLIKKQGKGTFVIKNKIERKFSYISGNTKIMSFTEELRQNQCVCKTKLLEIKEINPIEEFNLELGISPREKLLYMKRLRFIDNSPLVIEENYFSYQKYQNLLNENLEQSLYSILEDKYNIIPYKNSRMTIEITKSDEEQSKLLNINNLEPLFFTSNVIYDKNNDPVHIAKRYIIGSKYKIIV